MRVAVLICFAATVACASSAPAPPPVPPPVVACTPSVDAGVCDAATSDDGGPAALATCDGGAAPYYDTCQLPPSVCADSRWAAYFDNGVCGANGTCELVTKYHYCDSGCQGGGCINNRPTLAGGRGF